MDELVRSKKLQFEKSNYLIQIYKQETGIEYIKIPRWRERQARKH